jgi:threonine dehydratase
MILEEKIKKTGLTPELDEKFKQLWYLVGNTPMLELKYTYNGKPGMIYVKCEHYNLTGSVKDRMALYILYQAYIGYPAALIGDPIRADGNIFHIACASPHEIQQVVTVASSLFIFYFTE